MTRNTDFFIEAIEKQRKKYERMKPGNIAYGSNVMPILQLYKGITEFEEQENFREALENLLINPDAKKRRYAIDVCLGFLVFSDAIL